MTRTNYWAALSISNTNVALNINPFNLMERWGFYREKFACTLFDGRDSVAWSFQLRTRSPVAAGYSVVHQRPGGPDISDIAVPPYIDFTKTNEQVFGFYGLPRTPYSSVTNTLTRGSGDTNGYQGYLDVVEGASVTGEFTNVALIPFTRDTNGVPTSLQVEINLAAQTNNWPNSVLRYDATNNVAPYAFGTNPPVNLPVRAILLKGAGLYSGFDPRAVHIVVPEANTNVTRLFLTNDNYRPVYLHRRKEFNDGSYFNIAKAGDEEFWRLGLTFSQCNVYFETAGLTIQGGLRTDGGRDQQGMPTFEHENNPGGLDFIADRVMWLEDYRVQQ